MTSKGMTQQQWRAQSRERDARTLELRMQGVPLAQIALRYGCTYEAVRLGINRELRRRGLQQRMIITIMPAPRAEGREELLEAVG